MKKYNIIAILLLSASLVRAATLYVDINNTSPASPYGSWETAATNIQAAVDAASTGDTVLIADGTYVPALGISVTNEITIKSLNGPEFVIVDGSGSNQVFNLGKFDITLSGLTITNGFDTSSGGGIYCPSLYYETDQQIATNCWFLGNEADQGGGMYRGIAKNCRFEENTGLYGDGANDTQAIDCEFISNGDYMGPGSDNGGGMFDGEAIRCVFSNNMSTTGAGMAGGTAIDCVFVDNTAWHAGGMQHGTATGCIFTNNSATYNGGGINKTTVSNCTVIGNYAGWDGGGAYESTATDCLFQENTVGLGGTSKSGGGMFEGSATDCTFIANEAPNRGGGFFSYETIALESCTFTSNSAAVGGGACVKIDTILNNCVFDHNEAGRGGGLYQGIANNCTFTENSASVMDGGGMYGGTANNCIGWNNAALSNANFSSITTTNSCWTADPLFEDAANRDFHLLENSPCIDSGSNALAVALTRDHDGNDRIQNGTVDYGAYEFVPPILTTNTLTVISVYGSPSPAVGSTDYPHGTVVACSVDAVTVGQTNYSPTGWTLSNGQEPASGTTNWFELTSTTNATLTWLWQTNYWLDVNVTGHGSVDVSDGFYAKDSEQILTAVPDAGWLFMGWSGAASGTNEAFVTMSEPQTIMATFSDDADGDGLTNAEEETIGSDPWNPDTDGDGFGDKLEVDNQGSPIISDQWRVDYIHANGTDFDLYPSNVVLDVAVGQILLETAGGTATLNLQLEESEDLITWTNAGDSVEWIYPVGGEKKFFRVRSGK